MEKEQLLANLNILVAANRQAFLRNVRDGKTVTKIVQKIKN